MKKALVVSALVATSTVASAFDYKINVDGKVDYINSTTKTTSSAAVTTTVKDATFKPGAIRLNMLAKVSDDLSLRMRYRFNVQPDANTNRDGTTGALDMFFLDHKNSLFTTRFGKQYWGETLGRESMISGNDLMTGSSAAGAALTTLASQYRFGVSALKSVEGIGNFTLALSNPNIVASDAAATTTTAPVQKNTSPAYGAYYNGSFMDKMIQPVIGYTVLPQDQNTDLITAGSEVKKANNTVIAYGVRSEFMGAVLDVDMKAYKKADINSGTNTTAANKEVKIKSTYANLAYAVGDFTPFVSYLNDKNTDVGTTTNNYKKNTYAVGTWYKPYADVGFRYDLHMLSSKKKFTTSGAANTQVKNSSVYFGIKADI
jgi:hypothetical protein